MSGPAISTNDGLCCFHLNPQEVRADLREVNDCFQNFIKSSRKLIGESTQDGYNQIFYTEEEIRAPKDVWSV